MLHQPPEVLVVPESFLRFPAALLPMEAAVVVEATSIWAAALLREALAAGALDIPMPQAPMDRQTRVAVAVVVGTAPPFMRAAAAVLEL
jgi:hypothetical protein